MHMHHVDNIDLSNGMKIRPPTDKLGKKSFEWNFVFSLFGLLFIFKSLGDGSLGLPGDWRRRIGSGRRTPPTLPFIRIRILSIVILIYFGWKTNAFLSLALLPRRTLIYINSGATTAVEWDWLIATLSGDAIDRKEEEEREELLPHPRFTDRSQ